MRLKLVGSMIFSLTMIIGITTMGIFLISLYLGQGSLIWAFTIAVIFTLFQWAIAPSIISRIYRLVPAEKMGYTSLVEMVNRIARRAKMRKPPKVYIARIALPNAFAFGNILTGKKVAITEGLLQTLNDDEIEAVLGHELGHIRHKDVEIMMIVSLLPAIFYYIGRWFYYASWFRTSSRDEDNPGAIMLIIALASLFIYFILSLFMLWLSRVREHYADLHAVETVDEGAIKLSRALVKLHYVNRKMVSRGEVVPSQLAFKALFISDPEEKAPIELPARNIDELVISFAKKKITGREKLKEIFSSHPLTPKRIRLLLEGTKSPLIYS
ncbi:MAG: zinc metalloprotease HtpX [Candidatus Njordarchaeales archaeon]